MPIPDNIKPRTVSDFYLEDIAASLRELVQIHKVRLGIQTGEVVVNTSASPSPESGGGQLPPDFPGRAELEAAGIETLEDVPRSAGRLKRIHGIGPATATEILKALGG